jgi:hypothetical protein
MTYLENEARSTPVALKRLQVQCSRMTFGQSSYLTTVSDTDIAPMHHLMIGVDVWRNGRKFMHQVANAQIATNYHPTQEHESTRTVLGLIREPKRYEHWFELYSSSVIFRIAFGKRIDTGDEEVVKRIIDVNRNLERIASPGAYLVGHDVGVASCVK